MVWLKGRPSINSQNVHRTAQVETRRITFAFRDGVGNPRWGECQAWWRVGRDGRGARRWSVADMVPQPYRAEKNRGGNATRGFWNKRLKAPQKGKISSSSILATCGFCIASPFTSAAKSRCDENLFCGITLGVSAAWVSITPFLIFNCCLLCV